MSEKKSVDALLSGGEATAGPPLGPALGPLGINVLQVVKRINELTKDYAGMKVPVKIIVDTETKGFEVQIGTPTATALIVKELGIPKGSGTPNTAKVGNLTMDQVKKIAKLKSAQSLSKSLEASMREIVGTCGSMGVTVDGREPKEVLKEIKNAK